MLHMPKCSKHVKLIWRILQIIDFNLAWMLEKRILHLYAFVMYFFSELNCKLALHCSGGPYNAWLKGICFLFMIKALYVHYKPKGALNSAWWEVEYLSKCSWNEEYLGGSVFFLSGLGWIEFDVHVYEGPINTWILEGHLPLHRYPMI